MKIGIIVHRETLDKCSGNGCLNAFGKREDAFSQYDAQAQLASFTQDAGDMEKKIEKLKELGIEIVHLSTCVRGKNVQYEALAHRLSKDFHVVGYTHGPRQGTTRDSICLKKR